jgi:diadenylate cyclase
MQYLAVEQSSVVSVLRSIIDITLVFIICYGLLKLLQRTRSVPVLVGILIFSALYWLSVSQELVTLEFVLRSALPYVGFAIIVLFQSEIRQALIYFGNRFAIPTIRSKNRHLGKTIYDEIVLAVTTLSTEKIGALIVLERKVSLSALAEAGVQLDAKLSYDLLVTIFNPAVPLHDGAVIIRDEKIIAASVFLPLTKNPTISRELGTRHRAAIGITEDTDAVAIVVSEETGIISFVENGNIHRNLDTNQLREMILKTIKPSKQYELKTEVSVG